MVRQGRLVRSRTDYILGSDQQSFQNMAVRDPRHNYYHLMVLGCLCGASSMEHLCYLGRRTLLPLCPTSRQKRTTADRILSELRHAVLKPDKWVARHNSWVLA